MQTYARSNVKSFAAKDAKKSLDTKDTKDTKE